MHKMMNGKMTGEVSGKFGPRLVSVPQEVVDLPSRADVTRCAQSQSKVRGASVYISAVLTEEAGRCAIG